MMGGLSKKGSPTFFLWGIWRLLVLLAEGDSWKDKLVWEAKFSFVYDEVDVSGNSQVGWSARGRDRGREMLIWYHQHSRE